MMITFSKNRSNSHNFPSLPLLSTLLILSLLIASLPSSNAQASPTDGYYCTSHQQCFDQGLGLPGDLSWCDLSTNQCVNCFVDSHCSGGATCVKNECFYITRSSSECGPEGEWFLADLGLEKNQYGKCEKMCSQDSDCPESLICSSTTMKSWDFDLDRYYVDYFRSCIQPPKCGSADARCYENHYCKKDDFIPWSYCTKDCEETNPCPSPEQRCNTSAQCILRDNKVCSNNPQWPVPCDDPSLACLDNGLTCGLCNDNDDCQSLHICDSTQHCTPDLNVQCTSSDQCLPNFICGRYGVCVQVTNTKSNTCDVFPDFNEECLNDTKCINNQCLYQCTSDDQCPIGIACRSNGTCGGECDVGHPSGLCINGLVCVGKSSNGDPNGDDSISETIDGTCEPCSIHSQTHTCPLSMACLDDGTCNEQCTSDNQCNGTLLCWGNQCGEVQCSSEKTCVDVGEECVGGYCQERTVTLPDEEPIHPTDPVEEQPVDPTTPGEEEPTTPGEEETTTPLPSELPVVVPVVDDPLTSGSSTNTSVINHVKVNKVRSGGFTIIHSSYNKRKNTNSNVNTTHTSRSEIGDAINNVDL